MIGIELVREVIESVILTGRVRGIYPASLLLIATPESGKTSVVLAKDCKNVKAFTDVTGNGILKIVKQMPDLTHIVINDMVAVLSHRGSVNKHTVSTLNAMTEEGVNCISTPGGIEEFPEGKRGVIASLTTDLVADSRNWWNKIGFTTRMIPFCYKYPDDLVLKIKDSIDAHAATGRDKKEPRKETFGTPKDRKYVRYPPSVIEEVRRIADYRAMVIGETGLRRLKQYHALVQGHALLRSFTNPEVNNQDVEFLKQVDMFISYDIPRALEPPRRFELTPELAQEVTSVSV